ncbi:hypothetical protein [Aeromonas sp. Y318-3]|uniref:hypothetical protein n=1 Tax=Aeromonas sp. Y318-3 TaxID=2990509 RepID=UPI0022E79BEE|nr:hypothetical protein [Aeromonas sp. Y318-3]
MRRERLEHANALIKLISSRGRRFFYNKGADRTAEMWIDLNGRIWFMDDYTGQPIYTLYRGRWRGFSHGGTLRDLVIRLHDYIAHGHLLSIEIICPTRNNPEDGNIWGYPKEEAELLRQECEGLPLFCTYEPGMNRERVRDTLTAAGITVDSVTVRQLRELHECLRLLLPQFTNCYEGTMRINGYRSDPAFLTMRTFSWKSREAVSFNSRDQFIGIAGWADDRNVVPLLVALLHWASLIEYRRAKGGKG